MARFEVIPYRVQVCPDGTRASVFGAAIPGAVVQEVGFTYRDNVAGTVGGYRIRPGMSHAEVSAIVAEMERHYTKCRPTNGR